MISITLATALKKLQECRPMHVDVGRQRIINET